MSQSFYSKEIKCPICNNKFTTLKLKTSAAIVSKKDEDFCTHYKDLNPMFYEIIVCPVCAYSASENSFEDIPTTDIQKLREIFSGRDVRRTFCYERAPIDALDTFKLALYTANLRHAKSSIIAGLCLKIAWMYRFMEDERELQFMKFALDNYKEAFSKESPPIGNLNEFTMMYLLGELSRRVGDLDGAVFWFSKAVASPEKTSNPRIERMVRDQWALAKEQYKSKDTSA